MDKKQKQFDKLINEWKQKCEDITVELEVSQGETRKYSTELFKLKTQYEESHEQIDSLRKENHNLADEIKVCLSHHHSQWNFFFFFRISSIN